MAITRVPYDNQKDLLGCVVKAIRVAPYDPEKDQLRTSHHLIAP